MRGPSLENFLLSRVLGFSVFWFRLLGLLKAIYKGFFSLQGSFKGWGPLSSFSSRVVTTVLSGSPLQAFRILVIRDLGDGFAV